MKINRKQKRYAAKLLFQFRVMIGRSSGKMRICEERIINLKARSGKEALKIAQKRGKEAEYKYHNLDGNPVFFEFVGVMDLQSLGIECESGEVWYDIVERLKPKERRLLLIPPENELAAIIEDRVGGNRRIPTPQLIPS